MHEHPQEIAHKFLRSSFEALSEREQRIVQHVAQRRHISRDANQAFDAHLTFGQRLADRVAAFGGSWTFILLFGAILLAWVVLNSWVLARRGEVFDPYPYILLNLVLSMLAALQAPIIMMSQNRQAAKDRLDAAHDYDVKMSGKIASSWRASGLSEIIAELIEHEQAENVFGFFAGQNIWNQAGSKYRFFFTEGVRLALGNGYQPILAGCFYRTTGLGVVAIMKALGSVFEDLHKSSFDSEFCQKALSVGYAYGNVNIRFEQLA